MIVLASEEGNVIIGKSGQLAREPGADENRWWRVKGVCGGRGCEGKGECGGVSKEDG